MADTRSPLLSVDEARKLVLAGAMRLGDEQVSIVNASGRVLAQDVVAKRTQPPFAASAMDGFALREEDRRDQAFELNVVGESSAGHGFQNELGAGECVRIFTGAPLPPNAKVIAIQENVEASPESRVNILKAEPAGKFIRPAGGDFQEGETCLTSGQILTPPAISLVASAGHIDLKIARRPLVALLSTGDELVPPGQTPGPDQIVSSNALGVGAIAQAHGAEITDLGIARDTKGDLMAAFEKAESAKVDIIVTLGGASVGDHDLVRPSFEATGGSLYLYKIAMRPGKPFMFGHSGDMRLLGLPGNPVSSLVCARLFLVPLIHALQGTEYRERYFEGELTSALNANDEREDYSRCLVVQTDGNTWKVNPFKRQDSSLLSLATQANALIRRSAHDSAKQIGDPVSFLFF
jgi:molybdopterin molybdotransferase